MNQQTTKIFPGRTADEDCIDEAVERAIRESEERARKLEVLNRVSVSLAGELNLEKLMQAVTDAGREVTGAEFGAFFYNVTKEKGEANMLYTLSGAPREAFAKFPMPRNTAIFDPAFQGEGVVRIGDVTKDRRYGKNAPYQGMPTGHLPVRSYLAVPVRSRGGSVLGGLFFGHPEPDVFTAEGEQALMSIAAQAGIAIENANFYRAAERELAAQKQAYVATQRLASIVESSDDAMISKDLNGIIQTWNAGAERVFGYSAEEVIGKPVTILMPPERVSEEPAILERIRSGERIDHYETVRRRKDGRLIHISLTVSPIRDELGNIIGASKVARDISDKVLAREELERTVAERTASLREAIEQMEEFSYTVSHDLRAPIRAMQGYATVLAEDYGERLDDRGRQYLDYIRKSGVRMDSLIRDVLMYTRISRTDIKVEAVALEPLLRAILSQYPEFDAGRADIVIEVGLPRVLALEASLGQAIANLLSNAVKFVAPGVRPAVHVSAERKGDKVTLLIKDNGIGIKPEYQKRLFRMFERLHPRGSYEGTGVGLAIVRKAVERMGGKVGTQSDGVNGSTFWIELPAADGANCLRN